MSDRGPCCTCGHSNSDHHWCPYAVYLVCSECDCGQFVAVGKAPDDLPSRLIRERELLRMERNALLAGKWAGPWECYGPARDNWFRHSASGSWVAVATGILGNHAWQAGPGYGFGSGKHVATIEAAKAAADEALRSAGWFLA